MPNGLSPFAAAPGFTPPMINTFGDLLRQEAIAFAAFEELFPLGPLVSPLLFSGAAAFPLASAPIPKLGQIPGGPGGPGGAGGLPFPFPLPGGAPFPPAPTPQSLFAAYNRPPPAPRPPLTTAALTRTNGRPSPGVAVSAANAIFYGRGGLGG